jgi:hypothetical protein
VLLLAVLAGSFSADSPLTHKLHAAKAYLPARRKGTLVSQRQATDTRLDFVTKTKAAASADTPGFWARHSGMLRYTLPAFAC